MKAFWNDCGHGQGSDVAKEVDLKEAGLIWSAPVSPKIVRSQLKAWCTRKLKELLALSAGAGSSVGENWWAERGSQRYINDTVSLEAAIIYVRDGQDIRPDV